MTERIRTWYQQGRVLSWRESTARHLVDALIGPADRADWHLRMAAKSRITGYPMEPHTVEGDGTWVEAKQ
jgi:hypothetical protein